MNNWLSTLLQPISLLDRRELLLIDHCTSHRLPVKLLQQVLPLLSLLIINDVPVVLASFPLNIMTTLGVQGMSHRSDPSRSTLQAPLVFTRVCRLWQVIAYSTTHIWSHIQVVTSFE